MTWTPARLGDVMTLKRGHDLPGSERAVGDVPVVASSGITGYHDQAKAQAPGVITGRYGTLGEVFYLDEDYWPLNTALYVVDFKGNNPRFLAYLLRATLQNYKSDKAAVPGVNRNVLHELEVLTTDVSSQERIATLLARYDDLITNNIRRIQLLMDAARALYQEWFSRLKFPGAEHSHVVDGTPEGWTRHRVAAKVDLLRRGVAPHYDDDGESRAINQKCIRHGLVDMAFARKQTRSVKPEFQVQPGDVLVNSTGEGTLGRVAQVLAPIPNCIVDSHVTIVRPAGGPGAYYFGQALMQWEPRFATMGRGATNQTELSRDQIGDVELLWPPRPLLEQFDAFCAPLYTQISTLTEMTTRLRNARDLLLPSVMKGHLTP